MTKFMWNGIKVDGTLYKAHYLRSDEVITIYGKGYTSFPLIAGLQIENDSDIMTDYFENDRIRVSPGNTHYQAVLEAFQKQEEHYQKKFDKLYSSERV